MGGKRPPSVFNAVGVALVCRNQDTPVQPVPAMSFS